MLRELIEVLERLKQGPSQSPQRVQTSETSGDETDTSKGRWKILSKETFRIKKVYTATEPGRFFVTGPSDAANMPSYFTVGCAGRMSLCSHKDIINCCCISKAVVILPVTSVCVWKHLAGACWISTEIH